MMLTS